MKLAIQNPTTFFSELPDPGSQFFDVSGDKRYELTNHLGNVLSVVNDNAPVSSQANLVCSNDYFPFGSQILERSVSSGMYRFGFNTQERTDEIAGVGNHNTALFWEYDTRLGRRWNLDPRFNYWEGNYTCFGSNPISNNDIKGDMWLTKPDKNQADKLNEKTDNKIAIVDKKIIQNEKMLKNMDPSNQEKISKQKVIIEELKADKESLIKIKDAITAMESDPEYAYTYSAVDGLIRENEAPIKKSDGEFVNGLTTWELKTGENFEKKKYQAIITMKYVKFQETGNFLDDSHYKNESEGAKAHESVHGGQAATRKIQIPKTSSPKPDEWKVGNIIYEEEPTKSEDAFKRNR